MQPIHRRWQQRMVLLSFVIALGVCWLIAGSLLVIFTNLLLILWLVVSSGIVYGAILYWRLHWDDQPSTSEAESSVSEPGGIAELERSGIRSLCEQGQVAASTDQEQGIIGRVFYYGTAERSQPQIGLLSFRAGVLHFAGNQLVDFRDLPLGQEETCQVLIGDQPYDYPRRGRLVADHPVRLVVGHEAEQELACFLMPMAEAQLFAGLVGDYLEQRQRSFQENSQQFLQRVGEVVNSWRKDSKAQAIAQAFLQKSNPITLQRPQFLVSVELRLRDKLPDGCLGRRLFWVTACQAAVNSEFRYPDSLAEEARGFYSGAFQLFVRLLVRDCEPEQYPFIIYEHAAWLLLREFAVAHFAAGLWGRIRPTGRQVATSFTLSAVLDSYVEKHDERAAYAPENLLQLTCLLVHLGLMTAPAFDSDVALQQIYDQTKNILLLEDAVRLQISDTWERVQLERFERDLFSPGR